MYEQAVEIATNGGPMTTFVVRPERGGPHPLVLFLMDAAGIREELRDMARRLASTGYYVMLPNLFHRSGVLELPGASYDEMRVIMEQLTMAMAMEDCDSSLAFAAADPFAEVARVGVVGYCMSGQYAVNFAARRPDRVAAAASFHGVRLVTDGADSPHLMMQRTGARFYFGCAELDPWAPLSEVRALADTAQAQGVNAEVEILDGLDHGFVFPGRDAYDKLGAERHWERLQALFRQSLDS